MKVSRYVQLPLDELKFRRQSGLGGFRRHHIRAAVLTPLRSRRKLPYPLVVERRLLRQVLQILFEAQNLQIVRREILEERAQHLLAMPPAPLSDDGAD